MRALYVSALTLLIIVFGALFVFRTVGSGVTIEPQVLAASTFSSNQSENIMIADINATRREVGVFDLIFSPELQDLTDYRVQDMVKRDYYSHKTPEGYTYANFMNEYYSESSYSCENLQLQVGDDIKQAVKAWQNSSAHYRCLTNPNISKVSISYAAHGEVIYDQNNQPQQMYVFAFIASN